MVHIGIKDFTRGYRRRYCDSMFALLLFFGTFCSAQEESTQRPSVSNDELLTVLNRAEQLPIEYREDITLQVINSGKIQNRQQREELLVRLFEDASTAKYRFQQKDAIGASLSRHREVVRALTVLDVSELAIRTRVIRTLLRQNPLLARRLFDSIRLEIPTCSCASPVVFDVSDYYALATEIVNVGIYDSERKHQTHITVLADIIHSITSPVELGPAAEMLANSTLSGPEFNQLFNDYVAALKRVSATDREIQALETKGRLTFAIELLANKSRAQESAAVLLREYRAFLIRSLKGRPCSDRSLDREAVANRFQGLVDKFGVRDQVGNVTYAQISPTAQIGDSAQIEKLPDGAEFRDYRIRLDKIRASATQTGIWIKETESQEMTDLVNKFLDSLRERTAKPGECSACVFDLKNAMYLFLIDSAMPNHGLERTVDDYVRFLALNPAKNDAPAEWLFGLMRLLNQARTATEDQNRKLRTLEKSGTTLSGLPSAAAMQIHNALRQSDDPVLGTYEATESLLRLPYMSPYERFAAQSGKRLDP
jgi:hypothetical protein